MTTLNLNLVIKDELTAFYTHLGVLTLLIHIAHMLSLFRRRLITKKKIREILVSLNSKGKAGEKGPSPRETDCICLQF